MKTEEELKTIKEALSAVHKPLYTLEIDLEDDEMTIATIYLKKYDRITLSAVQKLATSGDALKATEAFLKATYVGGDDLSLVLNNLDALRSCEQAVVDMISVKAAKLSKN